MVESAILNSVGQYLQTVAGTGVNVSFGVIFGSCVSGTADEMSDIDLVVISPDYDGIISREQIAHLWRIAARVDSRIEPIPCGAVQWQQDQSSAILEIARTAGQRVNAA